MCRTTVLWFASLQLIYFLNFTDCLLFHVAPMQCYTNRHLRMFYRLLNPKPILWTEMEKVDDLLHSESAFHKRLKHSQIEHPLVLQLGGNNISKIRQTIELVNEHNYHFSEINLNVGCPSIETGGADYGASLMLQPELTREILMNMADAVQTQLSSSNGSNSGSKAVVPISIKCRIAAYQNSGDAVDSYENLYKFISTVTQGNGQNPSNQFVSHIIVHARAAILSGLSSAKNRSIPPLRPEYLHQLAQDFPHIRVTLNGGINSIQDIQKAMSASEQYMAKNTNKNYNNSINNGLLDGVMAGRWCLRRPLDLWDLNSSITDSNNGPKITLGSISTPHEQSSQFASFSSSIVDKVAALVKVLQRYSQYAQLELMISSSSSSVGVKVDELLLPLILVLEQLREDYDKDCGDDDNFIDDNFNSNTSDLMTATTIMTEEDILLLFRAVCEATQDILHSTSSSNSSSNSQMNTKLTAIMNEISISTSSSNQIKRNKSTYNNNNNNNDEYDSSMALVPMRPLFRKLSQLLCQICGKKVGNKILKNRSEAVAIS